MSTRTAVTTLVVVALFGAGLFGLVHLYRAGIPAAAPAAAAAPVAPAAPARPALAAASTSLGTVVAQDGYPLYRFDKDSPKPPKSTCVDKCAVTWPPVIVQGTPPVITGVDPSAVGTVARPDGSLQLTIGNWPVYRYSGDKAPGQTAGQGVGGTWFLVGVDGKKLGAPQAAAPKLAPPPTTAPGGR